MVNIKTKRFLYGVLKNTVCLKNGCHAVIGARRVGKTVLFLQLNEDFGSEADYFDCTALLGRGRDDFDFEKYYQNAEGIFLLFDVTNEDSFKNVKNWISDVKDNSSKSISPGENGKPPEISLYLLGNKIDKDGRVISKDEAEKMAHSLGMKYFEISCKYDVNVPEAISEMIYDGIMRLDKNNKKSKTNVELRKSQYKKAHKKGFC